MAGRAVTARVQARVQAGVRVRSVWFEYSRINRKILCKNIGINVSIVALAIREVQRASLVNRVDFSEISRDTHVCDRTQIYYTVDR